MDEIDTEIIEKDTIWPDKIYYEEEDDEYENKNLDIRI